MEEGTALGDLQIRVVAEGGGAGNDCREIEEKKGPDFEPGCSWVVRKRKEEEAKGLPVQLPWSPGRGGGGQQPAPTPVPLDTTPMGPSPTSAKLQPLQQPPPTQFSQGVDLTLGWLRAHRSLPPSARRSPEGQGRGGRRSPAGREEGRVEETAWPTPTEERGGTEERA